MGEFRDKAIKPAPKKVVPPEPSKEPAVPLAPSAFPGGNALAALFAAATPIGYVPVVYTHDSIVEGNDIAAALARAKDGYSAQARNEGRDQIVEILRRNSMPREMYALIRNFQGSLIAELFHVTDWSDSQWARVQAYLGDQLPLNLQIQKHKGDRDAVFRDLQRISDEQALGMILEADLGMSLQPKPVTEYDAIPPAYTTRALVEEALQIALPADGYIQAIRLLLQKAARAQQAAKLRQPQPVNPGLQLGLVGLPPFHVVDITGATGDELVMIDAVMEAHLSLVLQIVRDADLVDWDKDAKARSRAFFALADLKQVERKIAVTRLDQAITKNAGELGTLAVILGQDDAQAVHSLIANASYTAGARHQDIDATTLDFAVERAGELVQSARGKVDAAKDGSKDKQDAQAELARVEGQLLDWDMMQALRRDPARLEQRLRALGATPLQLGIELLQQASSSDFDEIIATLKRIDPAVRVEAMIRSNKLELMPKFEPEQRELLAAYLMVATEAKVHPTTTKLLSMPSSTALLYWKQSPPSELPYAKRADAGILFFDDKAPPSNFQLIQHDLYAARPRTTIAIADILHDLEQGHGPAALGRIRQLEENDRIEVYADDRVRKAIDNVSDDWVRSALQEAWWNATVEIGVLAAKSGDTQAIFEATAAAGDTTEMRRGFVLAHRRAENPLLQLTPEETRAIEAYERAIERSAPLSGWEDKETFRHLLFGQPQIAGPRALDPTMEAEFMAFRLAERAGARDPKAEGQRLQDHFEASGPQADEAIARFRVYFAQVRDGGVTLSELAQLAELYHLAMRALDKFREDNVSFAHKVSHIVAGVVGAVVLIALTAGGATPFVMAAVTGLATGTAEAATGAAIRTESSLGEVAIDFASGTIDGIMMAVGNELGAAAVEAMFGGELAGLGAGQVASKAAGTAMKKVSHGFFASIVENAIAGAVGGAASEMFETAVDRATWDRGIAEGFARMLAAAARGVATGAVMGGGVATAIGVVGKLGGITLKLLRGNSASVANGVTRLLEASGLEIEALERIAAKSEAELVKVHELIEAGKIGEAEELLERLELPAQARAAMRAFARESVAARATHELGGLPPGAPAKFEVLDDRAFSEMVQGQKGDAAVIVENGEARIIVRAGSRASVMREELVHLSQFYGNKVMRARMMMLSRENLADWATKTVEQKAQIYLAHLEVEADAQRQILSLVEEDAAAGDADAVMRRLDAQETLNKLDEKLQGLRDARAAGALDQAVPKDAPILFGRGAQTPRISKTAGSEVKRLLKTKGLKVPRDLPTLKRYGYVPGYSKGKIFRLSRVSEATDTMPHLQVGEQGEVRIAERPSFEEQRFDAEQEWRSTSEAIDSIPEGLRDPDPLVRQAAQAQKESLAIRFHKQLAAKVAAKEIDEASAGMLLKWGDVLEEIDERLGGAQSKRVMNELLDTLPKKTTGGPAALSQDEIDTFRRAVRKRAVDYVKSVDNGSQRMEALRTMLEKQPEPSSQGSLFTAYRREVMFVTQESPSIPDKLFTEVERPIESFKLPKGVTRTPDDAVQLTKSFGNLTKGRYALEDKAGKHAFRIDQARDYARGLAGDKTEYKGLIYIFSSEADARVAYSELLDDKVTKRLLGIEGGIHVSFFESSSGLWKSI